MELHISRGSGDRRPGTRLAPEIEVAFAVHRSRPATAPLCFAPEVNLNFFVDGTVARCCLARSAPIGRYPDQTVAELWRSAAADAARQALRDRRLPDACEICRDQLDAGSFEGLMIDAFEPLGDLALADLDRPVLRSIEFELSNACNLECTMCNGTNSSLIRRNREHLPPLPELYDDRFLEQLRPFVPGLRRVRFLGGEPFVIGFYDRVWDLLAELNPTVDITIITNATVMNARVRSVLERLAPNIVASIDSVDADTYASVRRNATLERTLANLELFHEASLVNGSTLEISTCPMIATWRGLPDVVALGDRLGIEVRHNTVLFPPSSSLRSLGPADMDEVVAHLASAADRLEVAAAGDPVRTGNAHRLRGVARQVAGWAAAARTASSEPVPVEQRWRDELESWAGLPALLLELEGREVVAVDVPTWASWMAPEQWVGTSELEILPAITATVGSERAEVDLEDRGAGVVRVDLRLGGEPPIRLRILRLPHLGRDPGRSAMLVVPAPPVP